MELEEPSTGSSLPSGAPHPGQHQTKTKVVIVSFTKGSGTGQWYMWARRYPPVVEAVCWHVLRGESSNLYSPLIGAGVEVLHKLGI